jgi:hypothetical protein
MMTPTLMPTATNPEMTDTRITLRLLPDAPADVDAPRTPRLPDAPEVLLREARDFLSVFFAASLDAGGIAAGISDASGTPEAVVPGIKGASALDAVRGCCGI